MKKFFKRLMIFGVVCALLIYLLLYALEAWRILDFGPWQKQVAATILDVDKNFPFSSNFPPDPGEKGKKTIEGIDSDHDGVRDDVQRWIYAFVSKDQKKQMALRQIARSYQDFLRNDFELEARKANDILISKSIQCSEEVFTDELHGYTEDLYIRAKVLNTYNRTVRFWDNNAKVTTEEMSGDHPEYQEPCDNR